MGDEKIFSPHSTAVSPCCVYQELTRNFPYIPLSQLLVHSYHGTEALKSVKSGVNGENRWAKGALPSSQLRNKYGLIYVGTGLMLRGTQPTFQPAENPAVTPQAGSLVPVVPPLHSAEHPCPLCSQCWDSRDLPLHRELHKVPSTASSGNPQCFPKGKLCVLVH